MLSDMSCSTLFFDIPSTTQLEEDSFAPLGFDDLLDIAREFEFAHTITHIWPCDEESNACPETGLDGILTAIVPTPNSEERAIPLPRPTNWMTVQPVDVQETHPRRLTPCPASNSNACVPTDMVPVPQVGTVAPIMSTLQGWSPPNGSQFLDLDDNLMLPQPVKDMWKLPWPPTFLSTSSSQAVSENQSSARVPTIDDTQPVTAKLSLVGTINKIADNYMKRSLPTAVQPPVRAVLEPVRPSTTQSSSNVPSRTVIAPRAKTTPNHARPPRGGIPPHIARSVTKANILRVERERKVMQDAFSSTTMVEAKKPSVLRRTTKVEKESGKNTSDGSGKKLFDLGENGEKEQRATKRARV